MAFHVLRQLRDNVKTALAGLATTGANVFVNRSEDEPLQDSELPALRIYLRISDAAVNEIGIKRTYVRTADLEIQACVKKIATFEDDVYQILKEVEIAMNAGGIGAKRADIKQVHIEDDAKGEKPVAVGHFTFELEFYTQVGSPDAFQ